MALCLLGRVSLWWGPNPPLTRSMLGQGGSQFSLRITGRAALREVPGIASVRRCTSRQFTAMAAVREPTPAEVEGFHSLSCVFVWAKVKGDLACPGSRAGSLLRGIAGTDWADAEIEDVATVSPDDFADLLTNWAYSGLDDNTQLSQEDFLNDMLDTQPGPMLLGAARAMHHACRIKCKLEYTREAREEYQERMVAQSTPGAWSSNAPIVVHAPVAPVAQTVNIASLMDTGRNQDVPVITDDAFWKGIETWRRVVGYGLDDPPPAIRPSIAQYSAFLALVAMGSIYVDFCLCAPWDIRTNRSKKWKGLVLGADKQWREEECRGPPDFDCWEECFRLWECMCIMSEVLLPPRFTAYYNMVKAHCLRHAGSGLFGFWYQQEDRYRHEEIPDIKRLQLRLYDMAITEYNASGWWTPVRSEGSTLDPDDPWNHVMQIAVRSSDARHWWVESFKDEAVKVMLKLKNVSSLIDNDAPIAASKAEHAITPYVQQHTAKAPKTGRPEPPWKPAKAQVQPPRNHPRAPQKQTTDFTGKFKMCHGFTNGKCNEVKSGPCGPNSCALKPVFIHACIYCGESKAAVNPHPQKPIFVGGFGMTFFFVLFVIWLLEVA